MRAHRASMHMAFATLPWLIWANTTLAEEIWTGSDGTIAASLDISVLDELGLSIELNGQQESPVDATALFEDVISPGADLVFDVEQGSVAGLSGGRIRFLDGLHFFNESGSYVAHEVAIVGDGLHTVSTDGTAELELFRVKLGFDAYTETFTIFAADVVLTAVMAETLNAAHLAGQRIGNMTLMIDGVWVAGDRPVPPGDFTRDPSALASADGPDVTFCQLYGLAQYGRMFDVVGLSVATTSWNVGTEALDWYGSPSTNHPFIIMNLYRLMDDRIEQIGQSWIKHGFCALDNTQCGGTCSPTGCSTLNVGCTDTYSAGLNAGQNGLAPRHEVNPWTGSWVYQSSHFAAGNHNHDSVEHRLQVRDADLDPDLNPGATYYCESFYACGDDIDVWNSAAWKEVTVSGNPGANWSFGMSGSTTAPEIGFAIDAWTNAEQTIVAQEVPCVEFVSPDGRCVLSARASDIGGGMWHYEYAMLNIDMDRKVGSFSIPLLPITNVSNVGFHAVESYGEPYANDAWSSVITGDAITWSTLDNPIRWGTMYNFWFDADEPPANANAIIGHFEPGSPETLTAEIIGPNTIAMADCNDNGLNDDCEIDCTGCPQPCGTSPDCNDNAVPDECDIASGFSVDCDGGPHGEPIGGGELFNFFCQACHGVNGSGGAAPNIEDTGRLHLWAMLLEPTDHPGGTHPEFTDQDFADLEAFLATFGSRGRPDRVPDACQILGDCNLDGESDGCELESGSQFDFDYDGFPDLCIRIDPPATESSPKNRYVSFVPINRIVSQAVRVTVTAAPEEFLDLIGRQLWSGPPDGNGFASLQCQPHYQVWNHPVVHVGDESIVPAADYEIQVILEGENIADELKYSDPPTPVATVAMWGDVVGTFDDTWTPPNGVTNMVDVLAAVRGFQQDPDAAPTSWLDVSPETPNALVNFEDVQLIVHGFRLLPYPFQLPDPCP